jgi:lipocalin
MFLYLLFLLKLSVYFAKDIKIQHTVDLTQVEVPPQTVNSIDLKSYLGRWYQGYTSLLPDQTYEKNGYCITGDYFSPKAEFNNKSVSFKVVNSER